MVKHETEGTRYLGLQIDNTMNFKRHIAKKLKSGNSIYNLMRMVCGKLNHNPPLRNKTLRTILKQKLIPVLHFAAEVWDRAPQSYKKSLNTIHHKALALCEGVRTVGTNYLALCVKNNELPLHTQRDEQTLRTYCRMKRTMAPNVFNKLHRTGNKTKPFAEHGYGSSKPQTKAWAPFKTPNSNGKGHCYPTRRPNNRTFAQRAVGLLKTYQVGFNPRHMQTVDLKKRHQKVVQHRIPVCDTGMPITSKYGNSSTRQPGDPASLAAHADFNAYYYRLKKWIIKIFTDGSAVRGLTGAGSVWYRNQKEMHNFAWPISTMGDNILGEFAAFKESLHKLVQAGFRNQEIQIFIDCQGVISMYTTWNKPKENVDMVDTTRQYIKTLQDRGITLILNYVPSHVNIFGNEAADKAAERARTRIPDHYTAPNFNRVYGISYGGAKSAIRRALSRATQIQWDKTNTTLKMYKRVLQPSPYQDLGTAEQIRIRNGFMLGVGFLNYERNRFVKPEHIMKQLCPYCFAPETTDHFFTRCPLYTAPRDELYKQWLRVYHPRDPNARLFSTIGLLREPNTKEDICKHAPIIKAVNVYIERALQLRRTMMDWKDEERDWEDDSE